MDKHYAMKLTFSPEPVVESNHEFETQTEAQSHIDSNGTAGDYWIIVKGTNSTYTFIKGHVYGK